MINSILVANRGEIARRVFSTCRHLGIETVAVFSEADAGAPFVREADRAVHLPGNAAADTYLRGDLIIDAARKSGADAIHPGYGFLSENADFARAVTDAGFVWIGPRADTMEAMGSKVGAKEIMTAAGVPILSVDPATATAADYPLLVKASAGGGGRGMRVVERAEDLSAQISEAEAEAASAFGDGTVFVEPYLPTARHIEVQVMADESGNCWIVGDRDCSIQRRHQKVVEEAPAPRVADGVRKVLHEASRAAVAAVDYVGAGTVEFLVVDAHLETGRAYFLEMNTRLQVEHPVSECVTGLDLVALQIAVAEGRSLAGDVPPSTGHAVEVRLYAEDPANDWAPQTGTIGSFAFPGAVAAFANPSGSGLRVDSAIEAGSQIGIHYDAMIAKVIACGPDRQSALRVLAGGLRGARIHGIKTNIDLLLAIITDDAFAAADLHTALLGERLQTWTAPRVDEDTLHAYAAAAALADAKTATATARVLDRIPTAFRNVPSQPQVRSYRHGDREITVRYADSRGQLTLTDGDGPKVLSAAGDRVQLARGGVVETYDVTIVENRVDVDGPYGSISLTPMPRFVDPADQITEGSLLAPMPASVTAVNVQQGQRVAKGDTVVVLEAMKMQHTISAPVDGVVDELAATVGAQVESGAVLAVIEPHALTAATEGETR